MNISIKINRELQHEFKVLVINRLCQLPNLEISQQLEIDSFHVEIGRQL